MPAPFLRRRRTAEPFGTRAGRAPPPKVIDVDGDPIDGLYTAGNVMASAMGMTYGGAGGTLGPGMVFGYLAGRHIAARPRRFDGGEGDALAASRSTPRHPFATLVPSVTSGIGEAAMRQVTAPDGTVHVVRIEWIGNRIRRAHPTYGSESDEAGSAPTKLVDGRGGGAPTPRPMAAHPGSTSSSSS